MTLVRHRVQSKSLTEVSSSINHLPIFHNIPKWSSILKGDKFHNIPTHGIYMGNTTFGKHHALGNSNIYQLMIYGPNSQKPKAQIDLVGLCKMCTFDGAKRELQFDNLRACEQAATMKSPRNHGLEGPEWACHILPMDGWCIERGHKFEIRSVEIWAFARQMLFMLFPLQVGWKGSLSNSIIQPTILPTNCRIHTERLRPLEFWSVPECKICQFVCRWEGSRHFKTLEFFLHGCII